VAPQQRQLHGNTPTKQRQARNFKSLNIITSTTFETVDYLATSYSEVTINVQTVVPLLRHRAGNIFSIRRARATVESRHRETPAFIPPDRWPSASQQPRPQPCRLLHLGSCTAACIPEAGERCGCGSTETAPDRGLVWPAADRCR